MMLNSNYPLLLASAPLIGICMIQFKQPLLKKSLLIGILLLLAPGLADYYFKAPIINYIFYTLLFAFLWDLAFQKLTPSSVKISAIITSVVSFIFIFIIGSLSSFIGVTTQKDAWQKNNYEIRYYENRGWAGTGHLKIYTLHHDIAFGLYTKKLESQSKSSFDTISTCVLNYPKHNISFDKCTEEITFTNE